VGTIVEANLSSSLQNKIAEASGIASGATTIYYGTCNTSADDPDKLITINNISNLTLEDGMTFIIRFNDGLKDGWNTETYGTTTETHLNLVMPGATKGVPIMSGSFIDYGFPSAIGDNNIIYQVGVLIFTYCVNSDPGDNEESAAFMLAMDEAYNFPLYTSAVDGGTY